MGERKTPDPDLPRPLTRLDAVTLVIGAMVGSGVYIVSAEMLRQVRAPGLLLLAWVAAALVTVIGALSYGELAGMFPDTGGQYVYLREGISPLAGYLYGWTLFAVIQTGGIAAVAIAFARFATVFVPSLSARAHLGCTLPLCGHVAFGVGAQNVLAAVLVAATTAVNVRGVKPAARLQGALTVVNVTMLAGVVIVAISAGRSADALRENFGAGFLSASGPLHAMVPAFAASMVAALFAMDAWNNVGFSAGELRRPTRDVPFAMAAGVLAVTALYVLVNVAYLAVLPAPAIAHAADDRVATAVLEASLGKPGLYAAAGVIVLSTLGCAHGLVLSGARVYYAMARDGLFFRAMGRLHARYETPAFGLVTQAAWAIVLCLSGSYAELLELRHDRGAPLLCADRVRALRAAGEEAGRGAAGAGPGLSLPARALRRRHGGRRDGARRPGAAPRGARSRGGRPRDPRVLGLASAGAARHGPSSQGIGATGATGRLRRWSDRPRPRRTWSWWGRRRRRTAARRRRWRRGPSTAGRT